MARTKKSKKEKNAKLYNANENSSDTINKDEKAVNPLKLNNINLITIISLLGTLIAHAWYLGYSFYFCIDFSYINVNVAYILSIIAILTLFGITLEYKSYISVKKFFDKYKRFLKIKFVLLKIILPFLISVSIYYIVEILNYIGLKIIIKSKNLQIAFVFLLLSIMIISIGYSLFQIFGFFMYLNLHNKKRKVEGDNRKINNNIIEMILLMTTCSTLFVLTAFGMSYSLAKIENTFDIVENYAVNENDSKSNYAV